MNGNNVAEMNLRVNSDGLTWFVMWERVPGTTLWNVSVTGPMVRAYKAVSSLKPNVTNSLFHIRTAKQ